MINYGRKRSFMRLVHLSADTLSEIVFFLDSYDIAMLWLSGDMIMRQLLAQRSVVRRFSINFENRGVVMKIAFPRLISHFPGLRSLELHENRVVKSRRQAFSFELLPLTLEELILDGFPLGPLVQLLKRSLMRFKHLKRFKGLDPMEVWDTESLQALPSTIEDLEITYISTLSHMDQSNLPPNLKHFTCGILPEMALQAFNCPSQLQTLRLSLIDGGELYETSAAALIASLPACLESFAILNATGLLDCFEGLPHSLTRLELHRAFLGNFTSWRTTVPHLTHLSLQSPELISPSIFSLLPLGLKYAALEEISPMRNDHQIADFNFPPDLTFMGNTNWICPRILEIAPILPPKLIYATIWTGPPMAHLQALPRSISTIHLSILLKGHVDALPPHLTELKVNECDLEKKDVLRLPASITILQLDRSEKVRFTTLYNRFALKVLSKSFIDNRKVVFEYSSLLRICPTLTQLTVTYVRFETTLHTPSFWKTLFSASPQLQHLRLGAVKPPYASSDVDMTLIDPDIIYSLPPGLVTLHLAHFRGPLTDNHMIALPKFLRKISLLFPTSSDITDASIPHWPRHFTFMDLPRSKGITLAGAMFFSSPDQRHRIQLGSQNMQSLIKS